MGNGKGVNFVSFRIVFTTLIRQNVLDCVAPDDETLRQCLQEVLHYIHRELRRTIQRQP